MVDDKFKFKKSLGQNFLIDDNICKKIVDSADIDRNTLVIEIGPGKGAISKYIIDKCGYFIMYEIDERVRDYLEGMFNGYDNYEIIFNDFLKENVKGKVRELGYDNVYVVANVPYYITTPIINKFIDDGIYPDRFVIMVQKEVASRLTGRVGSRDYGSITVLLNYYYEMRKLFDVSKNCFMPKPLVDSAVIEMNLKNERQKVSDICLFKKIVRDSFKQKRKTIRNNLKNYDLDVVNDVLKRYGMDMSVRAECLNVDIFVSITNELSSVGYK